jgi:hypothetical protein
MNLYITILTTIMVEFNEVNKKPLIFQELCDFLISLHGCLLYYPICILLLYQGSSFNQAAVNSSTRAHRDIKLLTNENFILPFHNVA